MPAHKHPDEERWGGSYGEAAQPRGDWFDLSPPVLGGAGVLFLVGSHATHPTAPGSEPGPGGGHIELVCRLAIHLGAPESSP